MRLFLALALLSVTTSHATADYLSTSDVIQNETIEPMRFEVIDHARNGCWTNIGEVRDYGNDQLELAGFHLAEEGEFINSFVEMTVSGERLSNGLCVGSVLVRFKMPAIVRGTDAYTEVTVFSFNATVWGDDFNLSVLELAREFARETLDNLANSD